MSLIFALFSCNFFCIFCLCIPKEIMHKFSCPCYRFPPHAFVHVAFCVFPLRSLVINLLVYLMGIPITGGLRRTLPNTFNCSIFSFILDSISSSDSTGITLLLEIIDRAVNAAESLNTDNSIPDNGRL